MVIHVLLEYLFFMILPIVGLDLVVFVVIHFCIKGKKRKMWFVGYATVMIVQTAWLYRFFFPTYWKYPDACIVSDIVRYSDVEEIYGPFDAEGNEPWTYKAYYIYTDMYSQKHYYMINIDTEGFCCFVKDAVLE